MSKPATLFIGITAAVGASVFAYALAHWQSTGLERFLCYLVIAIVSSGLKIQIPGLDGTMSVNFLFILLGVLELSLPETLLIGCTAALVQCLWQARSKIVPTKVVFNVFMMANAIALSFFTYRRLVRVLGEKTPVLLVLTALVFFLANTLPVSVIISLTEGKSPRRVWSECHFWSFPYYIVGAAIVSVVGFVNQRVGWQPALLVLPPIYWVYRSYRLYLGKLEAEKERVEIEKRHVEDVASLHLRTIEALALAIEAKDHTTQQHLQRVRVFAVAIAEELGLPESDIEALRAAALLHDIGKLAVPEHIINKAGKLTPEEFEKVKIHPIVGADILERVVFPYPVAPIVRGHHEKWDGTGYPDGLKGEQIPVGARILAVVDNLDALISDRQYRGALPLVEAVQQIAAGSGTSYDPKVAEILERRYIELERLAQAQPVRPEDSGGGSRIPTDRLPATADGLDESSAAGESGGEGGFLSSIAAARQEAQTMFELTQDLGNSLSLGETLSVLSMRLRRLIPYDSMAVFLNKNGRLIPELVSGDNFRMLSSLNIPVGEGLCGWVAENRKPVVNANPQMESGYEHDNDKYTMLRSVLAVPLEGLNGVVGVLAMYRADRDAFTPDHLRILLGLSPKIALSVENALKFQQAENSATTDYLTGLPNARSLFAHLSRELARCRRTGTALAVMVCDLDNFKQINDIYGHIQGDKLLKDFSSHVKEMCRGYDYVARMGGDEFVVIAPGMKPDAAEEKARRLNFLAVESGRKIAGRDLIALSVGTSFCPEDGFDLEHLLGAADRRMYSVKQIHHEEAERDARPPDSQARGATVN